MQQQIETFLDWTQKVQAFKHQAIDLKYIGPEFGIGGILNSDIGNASEENEVTLLSVPLEICLNFRNMTSDFKQLVVELDNKGEEQEDSDESLPTQWKGTNMFENRLVVFYLFLIHELFEKKEDSIYFPYLDLLPQKFTTAIYYDEDEMAELKGTNLYKSIKSINENLENIYEQKVKYLLKNRLDVLKNDTAYTYERFRWAFSVVWSRVFPIEYPCEASENGIEIVPTLLPTVDILNHKFNAKITYFTGTDRRFYLKTREPLEKGTYVHNNYGAKSNDSFLLSYGFVIENNTEDTFYVQFGVSGDEQLVHLKKQYLEDNSLMLGYYLKHQDLPEVMLDAIRICVMDEDDFYFAKQHPMSHHRGQTYMFGVRNEYKTLTTLLNLFQSKKNLFSTTIQEDLKYLKSEKEFNMQNILIYRIGQKRIIEHCLSEISNKLRDLLVAHSKTITCEALEKDNILPQFSEIFLENSGKLSINFDNGFFFVVCLDDIKQGQAIFEIKSECLIDMDAVTDSPIGSIIEEVRDEQEEHEIDDEMAIVLYILFEMFSNSMKTGNHDAFFNQIRKYDFHTPLTSELIEEELVGTNAFEVIQRTKEGLLELFESIISSLGQAGFEDAENIVNEKNFFTAYSIFENFNVGKETILPLPAVPLLPQFSVEFEDGNLIVKACLDLQKNEQITYNINSLIKPVEDLVQQNFYPIDTASAFSKNMTYPIGLDEESLAPLVTQEKLDLLNHLNNISFTHYLRFGCTIGKIKEQLAILFTCNEEELNHLFTVFESKYSLSTSDFSSFVLEQVNQTLSAMYLNFIGQYSTTAEEYDLNLNNARVVYRLESKRLLSESFNQ